MTSNLQEHIDRHARNAVDRFERLISETEEDIYQAARVYRQYSYSQEEHEQDIASVALNTWYYARRYLRSLLRDILDNTDLREHEKAELTEALQKVETDTLELMDS